MGVICFSSLKGGVGKTSLSLNVAHAFAHRGCVTVLVDLDPSAHATRFFRSSAAVGRYSVESPLARLFLSKEAQGGSEESSVGDEALALAEVPLIVPLREDYDLLPAGGELRHFLWGRGSKSFASFFPLLLRELRERYDHVVIDTPPEFNVLTRNAIAGSDLVVVPVDSSEMSINSLEELVESAQHIKGPTWSIARTMVNRQASRVMSLSRGRLEENLRLEEGIPSDPDDDFEFEDVDAEEFMELLREQTADAPPAEHTGVSRDMSPIYLLRSIVYRTEQHNRLTFLGKTSFDTRSSVKLADQYLAVARELEQILALRLGEEPESPEFPLQRARI